MPSPSTPNIPSPGLRAAVLVLSMGFVLVTAVAVSLSVSDHLRQTAINEAVRAAESVVVASMGTETIADALADPKGPAASGVSSRLAELVSAKQILRIKVWTTDGHIAFSDLPALQGTQFEVDDDLGTALAGQTSTSFTDGSDAENEFERGLATRFLSIYLPIRNASGEVVGAYEMYEDAAPIEADVTATRRDVVLFVGAMAMALLGLIYVAFAGSSRLLTLQNRKLRDQAVTEQLLSTDLRRSEERFRSLVRNSVDVNMILSADGSILFEIARRRAGPRLQAGGSRRQARH